MMKKYKWSLLLGSLLFFKPNLDRIAFVESASGKAPYPFFHWKYSRWLEQQGNYRFRTSAFYVCNDVVLLSFHPC